MFLAGVMYALWTSMGKDRDPFHVIPAIPIKKEYSEWTKNKIRREILEAETADLMEESSNHNFMTNNV